MSRRKALFGAIVAVSVAAISGAAAFCGFYVAKADTKLFNEASKVAIMRDGERTVISMANDYQGELSAFALVVPVPVVLQEDQIRVADNALIDRLDAYTAPRLVEYFDEDPCAPQIAYEARTTAVAQMADALPTPARRKGLGVTVEAEYTIGEYDIVILSADESDGLQTWLTDNGYKVPDGAGPTLESYIKQNTKFFVAKVNLDAQAQTGLKYLRPLQIAFESPKFMLPIRLGTVNADGKQELFVFGLSRKGRIVSTNYRTVKIPSNMDVPIFVKNDFANFYKSMFDTAAKKEDDRAIFLEYAWDMAWCDPCAADPLSNDELRELGVYWLDDDAPGSAPRRRMPAAPDVYVTRLHVRYDAKTFPEDLMFKETGDRSNYQGRYVLRHPFKGAATCEAGEAYKASLPDRFESEAQTLARLTGWEIDDVRARMNAAGQSFTPAETTPWWRRMWPTGDKKDG